MKKIMYIFITALLFVNSACTEDFEQLNENPYQVTNESLEQDNRTLATNYAEVFQGIFGGQEMHVLTHDTWSSQISVNHVFGAGAANNHTYHITWNSYWAKVYDWIMSPTAQAIKIADRDGYPLFGALSKLFQIVGTSRLTTFHGPVIYSHYGEEPALYDSEEELYNNFFTDLDEIQATILANLESLEVGFFKDHDATYGADMTKWLKFTNSLRLRLAMRISKVNPALAKTQGEKALSASEGLIETNGDNFLVSLYEERYNYAKYINSWGDHRMGADLESVLVGYKDPRIHRYFAPVPETNPKEPFDNLDYVIADHPEFPYKGNRCGGFIGHKKERKFITSTLNLEVSENTTSERLFTAAETKFLKAEAALRGWAGAGSAQENYEAGVTLAFADWGATGVEAYLADNTSTPIDYVDPFDSRNSYETRMTNTVAWDEGADNEIKLEKIITQKWINGFLNSVEAWTDFRRTGYPKIAYINNNLSTIQFGVVEADEHIKRLVYPDSQHNNNSESVQEALGYLGGEDKINVRLWWDVDAPNF